MAGHARLLKLTLHPAGYDWESHPDIHVALIDVVRPDSEDRPVPHRERGGERQNLPVGPYWPISKSRPIRVRLRPKLAGG